MNGTADVDLELWDGDTKVIGWYGEIDEGRPGTDAYQGDTFEYSGYCGGEEYIRGPDEIGHTYSFKAFGYEAGMYKENKIPNGSAWGIRTPDLRLERAVS